MADHPILGRCTMSGNADSEDHIEIVHAAHERLACASLTSWIAI